LDAEIGKETLGQRTALEYEQWQHSPQGASLARGYELFKILTKGNTPVPGAFCGSYADYLGVTQQLVKVGDDDYVPRGHFFDQLLNGDPSSGLAARPIAYASFKRLEELNTHRSSLRAENGGICGRIDHLEAEFPVLREARYV
jgi:hypothetical protein